MISVPLKIPGGGRLEIHGPWPASRFLLMLSREDFSKDRLLAERVVGYFRLTGLTVVKYETEQMLVRRFLQDTRLAAWPQPLRRLFKAAYLLGSPRRWPFVLKTNRARAASLDIRLSGCRALLDQFKECEIFLWGRSAGGLLATHMADAENVRKIIAMGFPFRPPGQPDEPSRYTHLAVLRKPCLILQGTQDPYGGRDIVSQYRFASAVRVALVDTDHNFGLLDDEWNAVLEMIRTFISESSPREF